MFFMLGNKKAHSVYDSKHNSNREKQIVILIIPNGEGRETNSKGPKAKSERRRWH